MRRPLGGFWSNGQIREMILHRPPGGLWCKANVIRMSTLVVATAVLGGTAMLAVSNRTAKDPPPNSPAGRWLTTAHIIAQLKLPDLHPSQQGDQILVAGIVPTANDAYTTTEALRQVPGAAIETQITAADTVVDDLHSSLGEPGLTVSYLGGGRFCIAGVTNNIDHVQSAVESVRADYGSVIKRVTFDVKTLGATVDNVSSTLSAGSIQYVELEDGTRKFATVNQAAPGTPSDASTASSNSTELERHVNPPGN